jgi:16S rRNA (adenine1518-N6/adenine1519-N6)-dimethyltransferase
MQLDTVAGRELTTIGFQLIGGKGTIAIMSDNSLPKTKKSLGQHWLNDEASLQAMCDAVAVNDQDTVLEIGPGPGALTKKLIKQAKQVVAVEFDDILAKVLASNIPAKNLTVIHQDILKFDLTTLPKKYKVVANIPYYLTSNLLRTLAESSNPPSAIALLIQKEVAERVAASPGDMSLLSISVQLYYQPTLRELVPAYLFTPPPKVDSQIISLVRHSDALFTDMDTQHFFRVVKAGFAARRKTLLNSLSGGLRIDKFTTTTAIEQAGLTPQSRPQELSLEDWHKLAQQITA